MQSCDVSTRQRCKKKPNASFHKKSVLLSHFCSEHRHLVLIIFCIAMKNTNQRRNRFKVHFNDFSNKFKFTSWKKSVFPPFFYNNSKLVNIFWFFRFFFFLHFYIFPIFSFSLISIFSHFSPLLFLLIS